MDALKRFSIAAMATLLVAGLTPALAQTRDTRPEPQRPRVENGGGSDSSSTDIKIEPRLPKSTDGVRCLIKQTHGGPEVTVVNGTGKVIPAGTVVTFYMQPGNIQKTFKLETDWQPGQPIAVPVKLAELPQDAECAVKLATPDGGPEPETKDEPLEEGDAQPPGPAPDLPTGEGDPEPITFVPVLEEEPVILQGQTSCTLRPTNDAATLWGVDIVNLGPDPWPIGTKIHLKMPDGTEAIFVIEDMEVPVGDGYAAYNLFPKPQGWTCELYVTAAP